MPGTALLRTSISVVIIFSVLGIFGILIPALSAARVFTILGYTAICSIATDFPKVCSFGLSRI